MFGYVLPVKCEMRVRDYETYRAVYCGVCKQLGKSYGVFSRFLLNYDLVLVAVLADALTGESGIMKHEGCFANPVAKHPTLHVTEGLTLASDALVMLSYHKLCDNIQDEKPLKRFGFRLLRPFLHHSYKKAELRRPSLAAILPEQMKRQGSVEKAKCDSLDEACSPTATMCAAIFRAAGQTEEQQRILERLGMFAGQIVYLLDAAEDYEDDMKDGRYNPFIVANLTYEQATTAAKKRCHMAAGELALCYNLLDTQQYKDILDNIFFLGIPYGISMAGLKRGKRRTGHGQIESV